MYFTGSHRFFADAIGEVSSIGIVLTRITTREQLLIERPLIRIVRNHIESAGTMTAKLLYADGKVAGTRDYYIRITRRR